MNLNQLDEFLAAQIEARTPSEGIDAMCKHAPANRLVWWGCLSAWSIWRPTPPPHEDAALAIAARWVFQPSDELRRAAALQAKADTVGLCKWLLQAVQYSGGQLKIDDAGIDLPTPDVSGAYTKGFMHHLLATSPPVERATASQNFLQLARQAITRPMPTAEPTQPTPQLV
ncbi:hypothetical protein CA51_36710 [Rosistilla oblonga]|uniref:DUF6931 family protein n=1 Tax=Rosistilla oblonga TaxID=2527990 RepID=UPI00118BEE34|nr:hypothetical protein [Rosistilla oblonga]QDV13780.1 hypothetical protein CA51_36710 [Rosistilla oblonga]